MRYILALKSAFPKPSHILPQPYDLFRSPICYSYKGSKYSGQELFIQALGIKASQNVPYVWKKLAEEKKQVFSSPPVLVHHHLERIRSGYEIASTSDNNENPFHELGLYPWEIVKDKLRQRRPFGSDIYDWLIREAILCTKACFSPEKLACDEDIIKGQNTTSFTDLPNSIRAKYEQLSVRKLEFVAHRSSQLPGPAYEVKPAFNKFVDLRKGMYSDLPFAKRLAVLGEEFKKLLDTEKKEYGTNRRIYRRRDFREFVLENELSLVMDYIFKFGSANAEFSDWRDWRKSVAGDLIYLDQMYSPVIVVSDAQYEILYVDRIPVHIENLC